MAVYDAPDERRLRARLGAFENVTTGAGHPWHACDLTDLFGQWMAAQEYRESYFESPEDLDMALEDFAQHAIGVVRGALAQAADEHGVVAVHGLASLFGLMRASRLVDEVAPAIRGVCWCSSPVSMRATIFDCWTRATGGTISPSRSRPTRAEDTTN